MFKDIANFRYDFRKAGSLEMVSLYEKLKIGFMSFQ
jgi:hypothetical protein